MKESFSKRPLRKQWSLLLLTLIVVAVLIYHIKTFELQPNIYTVPISFSTLNKENSNSSEENNITSQDPGVNILEDNLLLNASNEKNTVSVDTEQKEETIVDLSEFIVNTPSCRLPKTELRPSFYADFMNWNENRSPDCSKDTKIATLLDEEFFLQINASISPNSCYLMEITRNPESDNSYLFVNERVINDSLVAVHDFEMMMINCSNISTVEANIPMKAQVLKKVQHWNQQLNKPINVLITGFDSTSRVHFLRGLPKTMEILNQLDFLSFEGYHTIEPSTLPNFFAMLMGLTISQVRKSCAPDWDTPFDQCPLIWKNFSAHNYVTVYLEDGDGSFNWGGQSGFTTDPTDYFLHALFQAIMNYRSANNLDESCVSSEPVPSFMLRYVRRFLEKFKSSPFFIFNFLNDPFHETAYAIPSCDEDLAEFFLYLKSQKDLLENTLIIIMGDHGDRINFFSHDNMEGYLERALPGLFLRIPDRLQKNFPEFREAASINTHRLTTAFDIHHTLLHIMSLSGLSLPDTEFQPSLHDRSSLFVEVPTTRTCDSVNIEDGYCVCNTSLHNEAIDNPFFVNQLITFGIRKLNSVLEQSKYFNVCEEWERVKKPLISANLVDEADGVKTVLLKFIADPEDSEFSAKFHVTTNSTSKEIQIDMYGEFSRINKYGNQSFCVGFDTDEDKKMKELCYCKLHEDKS